MRQSDSRMRIRKYIVMFVVCLCVTRRFKVQFVAAVSCAIFAYTTVYAGAVYLPMRAEENAEKIAPAQEISAFLYNDELSPEIISFNTGTRTAGLVQFLNPKAKVSYLRKAKSLPSTGIIIINNGEDIPFSPDDYDVVGVTEQHTILAYGSAARDYIKFKHTSN